MESSKRDGHSMRSFAPPSFAFANEGYTQDDIFGVLQITSSEFDRGL
jgi:hypothetical protein